ncbi:hypothetical protein [Streptomyces sp. NPDC029674]|uniref:hypothetical protein n=1 Tax=Streptomyces sp. NPDC029674 TaxID=3365297 RepID=UPI003850BE79
MRALPVRRLATTTLCATLILGTAGPAFASEGDATRDDARTAPRAPAPDAKALLGQVQQLDNPGGVLTPITDLLTAVLTAKDHKLAPEDVEKRTPEVRQALDAVAPAQLGPKENSAARLQKAVDDLLRSASDGDSKSALGGITPVITGLVDTLLATVLGDGLLKQNTPAAPKSPGEDLTDTETAPETAALPQISGL